MSIAISIAVLAFGASLGAIGAVAPIVAVADQNDQHGLSHEGPVRYLAFDFEVKFGNVSSLVFTSPVINGDGTVGGYAISDLLCATEETAATIIGTYQRSTKTLDITLTQANECAVKTLRLQGTLHIPSETGTGTAHAAPGAANGTYAIVGGTNEVDE